MNNKNNSVIMHIIQTKNLTKHYEKVKAVDDLNIGVNEGEVFGLLGPNGAGKTTLLMMLTTLLKPTTGTALVNGFDIIRQPAKVRNSIGIVFQDPSSDDLLTGYENLKLHGLLYSMPKDLIKQRIEEVLELVDLQSRRNDKIEKYSGGMRRRLEIARGLMHHPKILFLDEPTLGLDPASREKIWEYIEKMVREENITIILTTHYMEEAEKLCNRVAIIDYGKIVASDTPENLKKIIGGDIVILKVENADMEKINKLKYVKKVQKTDGELILTLSDAGKHLPELLQTIKNVKAVEVRTATLNDVFLHFTGREIRKESPEGGWMERIVGYRLRR
jgi:ABC-2 type transport system ATP-binding protein